MIFDTIDNFVKYIKLNKNFIDVSGFLSNTNFNDLKDGRLDINAETFALISTYDTKDQESGFIEYHKKYIDLQMIITGEENIGYAPVSECKELMFDEEKDYGKLEGVLSFYKLTPKNFMLLFPFEGHMPQICIEGENKSVKKIVIKINN